MCQGFIQFSGLLRHFVLAKSATTSIRVKKGTEMFARKHAVTANNGASLHLYDTRQIPTLLPLFTFSKMVIAPIDSSFIIIYSHYLHVIPISKHPNTSTVPKYSNNSHPDTHIPPMAKPTIPYDICLHFLKYPHSVVDSRLLAY